MYTLQKCRKCFSMYATQAQMIMYSKLFKINFTKMDPYEFKTFTDILAIHAEP